MKQKQIYIAVTNDLVTDNRVHRVASTLLNSGAKVTLIGRVKTLIEQKLNRPYNTYRFYLLFKKGPLFYVEYNIRLFIFLLFHKFDIIIANDLDTLLASYCANKIKNKQIVYDSHEYFTGVPEIQNRKIVKCIWQKMEKWIFPKLETIYTVNESIAKLYGQKYKKDIKVIRNTPEKLKERSAKTKSDLGFDADKKIIILQGAGINVDRGVEEAVQAMQYVENAIFLIIGSGDVVYSLKKMVIQMHLKEKVKFIDKLPFKEMMQYTQVADLGLTLDKDTNINYRYSLPNKVFDYIQAGIPVLASNLVEVANIVKSYNVGDIIVSHEPKIIAQKINEMLNSTEKRKIWKEAIKKASNELCWENESIKLKKIFKEL